MGTRREPKASIPCQGMDRRRETTRFAAEDETIARGQRGLPKSPLGSAREEPEISKVRFGEARGELLPGIDNVQAEMIPVIESRAAHRAIVDLEADRTDDPQMRVDSNACSTNIPGILRNFGLEEDHMSQW